MKTDINQQIRRHICIQYAVGEPHKPIHSQDFSEFQRLSEGHCQLQFCSDQPVWCALLLSASGEIEERKWEREIEKGVERCVKQQAWGISKICMDLPLTNTWHSERGGGWSMVGQVPFMFVRCYCHFAIRLTINVAKISIALRLAKKHINWHQTKLVVRTNPVWNFFGKQLWNQSFILISFLMDIFWNSYIDCLCLYM